MCIVRYATVYCDDSLFFVNVYPGMNFQVYLQELAP